MTLNDGFSVVAATRTTEPVLHTGQQAVLLRLGEPVDLVEEQHGLAVVEVALAASWSMTSRTSLTPAVTAESWTKRRFEALATGGRGWSSRFPGDPR